MKVTLQPQRMERQDLEVVSDFHALEKLPPAAFAYEYFANPDSGGALYFATLDRQLVATQAFVAQKLICNDQVAVSLMSERTLLSAQLRGQAEFGEFYNSSLCQAISQGNSAFVWGSTTAEKAFRSFGFAVEACFCTTTLVFGPAPFRRLLRSGSSIPARLLSSLKFLRSACLYVVAQSARRPQVRCERRDCDVPGLQDLQRRLSRKFPGTWFFFHSGEKLRWLVTQNPYRHRFAFRLLDGQRLIAVILLEDRGDGFATIIDFLIEEPALEEDCVSSFCRSLLSCGYGGVRFWGNRTNPYVRSIAMALEKFGGVTEPSGARLVTKPGSCAAPPVKSLAMTGVWGPPV